MKAEYLRYLLLLMFSIVSITLLSFQFAYAYFSDAAQSIGNTFSSASEFTPVTPPVTNSVGTIVINEIMWAGSSKSSIDEWIELINQTNVPVDLSNWYIETAGESNSNIVIPAGKIIPANGYFLIANYDSTHINTILNVTPDVIDTNIALVDGGKDLTLKNSVGDIIDMANQVSFGLGWFDGSNTAPRKSMERNVIYNFGVHPNDWHTATSQLNLDPGASESATPKGLNSL